MKSKNLSLFRKISHNFFNRKGGVSKGIYATLNCGVGSKDKFVNINKNLEIVKKKIGCKKKNLILLNQIHSNKIIKINKINKKKFNGDGVFTSKPGIALGILTADCAPILMYDKKLNTIGSAHSGWKGAYKSISLKLVKMFINNGSRKQDLVTAIGPCISKFSYEVKNDFLKKFLNKNKKNSLFFTKKNKKLYFDLSKYIKNQLIDFGVKNVEIIGKDTYKKRNNYFSSRYSYKNFFNDYGRNISIIMIK